jgi:hypothetical protein
MLDANGLLQTGVLLFVVVTIAIITLTAMGIARALTYGDTGGNKDRILKRLTSISNPRVAIPAGGDAPPPPPPVRTGPRRAQSRTPAFRIARLSLADRSELQCVIKDHSKDGLRIAFQSDSGLAERDVVEFHQPGKSRRARVVWRQGREAGLSFE